MKKIICFLFLLCCILPATTKISAATLDNNSSSEESFWDISEWESLLEEKGFDLKVVSEDETQLVVDLFDVNNPRSIDHIASINILFGTNKTGLTWGITMRNGHTFTSNKGKLDFNELSRTGNFIRVIESSNISGSFGYSTVPANTLAFLMQARLDGVLVYDGVNQIPYLVTTKSWTPTN